MTTTQPPKQRPKYATSVRQKFLVIFLLAGGMWALQYLSPPAEPIVIPLLPAGGKRLPPSPPVGGVPVPPRG